MAEEYQRAWIAHCVAEENLDDALEGILGIQEDECAWGRISCDPCDWDGWSVELHDARPGLVPTEEQLEHIWALGFTVIRIDYKDQKNPMSGGWWQVKGRAPRQCSHLKVPPPPQPESIAP